MILSCIETISPEYNRNEKVKVVMKENALICIGNVRSLNVLLICCTKSFANKKIGGLRGIYISNFSEGSPNPYGGGLSLSP